MTTTSIPASAPPRRNFWLYLSTGLFSAARGFALFFLIEAIDPAEWNWKFWGGLTVAALVVFFMENIRERVNHVLGRDTHRRAAEDTEAASVVHMPEEGGSWPLLVRNTLILLLMLAMFELFVMALHEFWGEIPKLARETPKILPPPLFQMLAPGWNLVMLAGTWFVAAAWLSLKLPTFLGRDGPIPHRIVWAAIRGTVAGALLAPALVLAYALAVEWWFTLQLLVTDYDGGKQLLEYTRSSLHADWKWLVDPMSLLTELWHRELLERIVTFQYFQCGNRPTWLTYGYVR